MVLVVVCVEGREKNEERDRGSWEDKEKENKEKENKEKENKDKETRRQKTETHVDIIEGEAGPRGGCQMVLAIIVKKM